MDVYELTGDRFSDEDYDYDPLQDLEADEAESDNEGDYATSRHTLPACEADDAPEDTRSPREKLDSLLAAMKPQKSILLGLLAFCQDPQTAQAVDERLDELIEFCYCVYDGVELRRLLEEAEGLEYLEVTESEQDEETAQEPVVASSETGGGDEPHAQETWSPRQDEQGAQGEHEEPEYLVITRRRPGLWHTTPAAAEILAEQDIDAVFSRFLREEKHYVEVYRLIVDLCREPKTVKELAKLVDDHPLLRSPRRYSGYFIERLEKSGGLVWRGSWCATERGLSLLNLKDGEQ